MSISTGSITYTSDRMTLSAATTAAAAGARVTLKPFTASTLIDLGGADGAGTLGLTGVELNTITAPTLKIGDAANLGGFSLSGSVTLSNLKVPTLSLETGGGLTQGSSAITVDNLALRAVGPAVFSNRMRNEPRLSPAQAIFKLSAQVAMPSASQAPRALPG